MLISFFPKLLWSWRIIILTWNQGYGFCEFQPIEIIDIETETKRVWIVSCACFGNLQA